MSANVADNGPIKLRVALSCAVAGLLSLALLAPAAQAKPGDLYIGNAGNGKILRVDVKTKRVSVVAKDEKLLSPDSGAFNSKGRLVIADYGDDGAVFSVNVQTGKVRTLADGGKLQGPTDVAIGPGGSIFAADPFAGDGDTGAILRIANGTATIISDGQLFAGGPLGLAVLPNGKILTADQNAGPSDSGALIRVNPATGFQTFAAEDDHLSSPYGMTLTKSGKFAFVADQVNVSIVRVNIATGAQKVIADGPPLEGVTDVAMGLNGMLYAVNDTSKDPKVIRIDPKTGKAKVFIDSPKLNSPEGITVEPR